ncbi:hypothetical protein M0812_18751 [Anaeramoeba flamelloides]|uniref:Uncharacterized protein n=1 Tax=Anaeramoeba flamelloides TaxID=1746091 RepID=A0AAV7ZAG9_9EUKA|nr:hypothetical protein M0812_18751 [Anaeramoeba flamelloides]
MREKLQERNNQIRVKKNKEREEEELKRKKEEEELKRVKEEEERKRRIEEEKKRIRLLRENPEWFKVVQKKGKHIIEEGSVSIQDKFVCDFKNKGKTLYDLNKDSLVMKKSSNKKVVRIVVFTEINLILYFDDLDSSSKFLKQFNRLKYQNLLKSESSDLSKKELFTKMSKNNLVLEKANNANPKSKDNLKMNNSDKGLTAEKSDSSEMSERSEKRKQRRSKKHPKVSLDTKHDTKGKKQKRRAITQRNLNRKDYSKNKKTVRTKKANTLKSNKKLSKSNSRDTIKKKKKKKKKSKIS